MSTAGAVDLSSGRPRSSAVSGRQPWLVLAAPLAVLALAVVLQVLPAPSSNTIKRDVPLGDYFPSSIAGWTAEDRPLGETEAVSKKVKDLLNYDDVFQRVYRKQGREFVVYVAYWRPGKMPARDISFHVPDVCWVGVGWKRTVADFHRQLSLEGRLLAPAQYREFDSPGDHEHVLFWHVVDGRTVLFSDDGPPSQWTMIKALFQRGYSQKGEQYLIRISSRTPFEELWREEGFQAIMELVAPLGPGLTTRLEQY